MRRVVKVKATAPRLPVRKTALSASAASRRAFPAWIDDDSGVAFPLKTVVTPRVRDGLVLRAVSKNKVSRAGGSRHASSAR